MKFKPGIETALNVILIGLAVLALALVLTSGQPFTDAPPVYRGF